MSFENISYLAMLANAAVAMNAHPKYVLCGTLPITVVALLFFGIRKTVRLAKNQG